MVESHEFHIYFNSRWEASKGVKFLVEGTEFRNYVHNQWEAFGARKENEKLQRQERKRQVQHNCLVK